MNGTPWLLRIKGYKLSVYLSSWLVLATGLGNPPAVRVWTANTGRIGSRPGPQPDPVILGRSSPDPYPSTNGFCRVRLDTSGLISGSGFWVSHLWSHSDMLLLIVKYWHWNMTVPFRQISHLDLQNTDTHAPNHILKMSVNRASTERQQSVNRASTEHQRYLVLHLRYYEWCLIKSIHKEGYGSLYTQICMGYSIHIFWDSNNLFHLQSYHWVFMSRLAYDDSPNEVYKQ